MAELKPCPFCGAIVKLEEENADLVSTYYCFNCDSCGMHCYMNELVPKSIAIEAWNRRYEPNQEIDFDYGAED